MKEALVIGIGNPDRGDDGVGPFVARLIADLPPPGLNAVECSGDPADLIALWQDIETVVAVDACQSGEQPGTIREIDVRTEPLPDGFGAVSTHGFGLAAAVELARAIYRLPRSLTVVAIEGESFTPGAPLSPAVEQAGRTVAAEITRKLWG